MPVATNSLIALAALCLSPQAPKQDPQPSKAQPSKATQPAEQGPVFVAYPERDALSPFRTPTDVYAPPDELFRQLSIMQNIANRTGAKKSYDDKGREIIDDPSWRTAYVKVQEIGVDAGILAGMMRLHRNEVQRNTAFYGAFYCGNISYVLELIAHIPGEPGRRTREESMPRAVEFMRANLSRKFGQLSGDEKATVIGALPEIGSPAAKAQGLTRLPADKDFLHTLTLKPFFQMLDLEESIDHAQALWFIKEAFVIRPDLPNLWLEPALPRMEQMLTSSDDRVRKEAIEIYQLIGPKKHPAPPSDPAELIAWAKLAAKHLFPPIRNLNDAIVQLYPSEERDAIAKAGIKALANSGIGDPYRGRRKDGSWFSGFRVARIPDELKELAIPVDSVITAVNGVPIGNAQVLLATVTKILKKQVNAKVHVPARMMVEYVRKGQSHAIEYRIM